MGGSRQGLLGWLLQVEKRERLPPARSPFIRILGLTGEPESNSSMGSCSLFFRSACGLLTSSFALYSLAGEAWFCSKAQ